MGGVNEGLVGGVNEGLVGGQRGRVLLCMHAARNRNEGLVGGGGKGAPVRACCKVKI